MNFLAHLYLSGDNEEVKLGNFIGDYVKGNKYLDYPEGVRKGIVMHRSIDHFTDHHPNVKQAAILLKPGYGRYSGIVVDVLFDHFLAKNWPDYSVYGLRDFTRNAHAIFLSNFWILPPKVKQFLPFLIQNRRLESYSTEHGIKKALEIMSRYTSLPDESDFAIETLQRNMDPFHGYFHQFMNDIIVFTEEKFSIKINRPNTYFLETGTSNQP